MKLYVLFISIFLSVAHASFDPQFVEDTKKMEASLEQISSEKNLEIFGLKRKIKKIMSRFHYDRKNSKKIGQKFIKFMENNPDGDIWKKLQDFLKQIYGHKITQFLIKVAGVDEVQKRILMIKSDYDRIRSKPDCPQGMKSLISNVSYLSAFVITLYYFHDHIAGMPLSNLAGTVASEAAILVCSITDVHRALCEKLIHRSENEIYYFNHDLGLNGL